MSVYGSSTQDIYFIPKHLLHKFTELAEMFFHHEVFSEIAIATILSCIQEDNKAHILNVLNRWDDDRDSIVHIIYNILLKVVNRYGANRNKPWQRMEDFIRNVSVASYHPVKWSGLIRGYAQYEDFYCNCVVPWLRQEMDIVHKNKY